MAQLQGPPAQRHLNRLCPSLWVQLYREPWHPLLPRLRRQMPSHLPYLVHLALRSRCRLICQGCRPFCRMQCCREQRRGPHQTPPHQQRQLPQRLARCCSIPRAPHHTALGIQAVRLFQRLHHLPQLLQHQQRPPPPLQHQGRLPLCPDLGQVTPGRQLPHWRLWTPPVPRTPPAWTSCWTPRAASAMTVGVSKSTALL